MVFLHALVFVLILISLGCAGPAGEFVFSVYGGRAFHTDADLQLKKSGGTDLEFEDVRFDDDSFEMPLYTGARASYWLGSDPHWGV